MKGDPLPEPDHVTRYCGGAQVHEDGSIDGVAFCLRQRGDSTWERSLSVDWLECLGPEDRDAQIAALRGVLAGRLKLGGKALIAVLAVGGLIERVRLESEDGRLLHVLHDPDDTPGREDLCHAGIFGLRPEDALIGDILAGAVTGADTYPARRV